MINCKSGARLMAVTVFVPFVINRLFNTISTVSSFSWKQWKQQIFAFQSNSNIFQCKQPIMLAFNKKVCFIYVAEYEKKKWWIINMENWTETPLQYSNQHLAPKSNCIFNMCWLCGSNDFQSNSKCDERLPFGNNNFQTAYSSTHTALFSPYSAPSTPSISLVCTVRALPQLSWIGAYAIGKAPIENKHTNHINH